MATRDSIDKETMRLLVEGKLPWEDAKTLLRMYPKDKDRFWTYLEVLQERVPWEDKILMRISDHLYIVRNKKGERVVKCDCGHEFGDYRVNWKLGALIRVRSTQEEFKEIYPVEGIPDPELIEIREFFCPGCVAQIGVEAVMPGDPLQIELQPDLDTFYRDWMEAPLPDESPEWFTDRTSEVTAQWAKDS